MTHRYPKDINAGAHGSLHLCRKSRTSDVFAMKVITRRAHSDSENGMLHEVAILSRCTHPRVVRLYYAYVSERALHLVCAALWLRCLRAAYHSRTSRFSNR